MMMQELPLGFHEKVIYKLRSVYNQFGYSQYKMSKFEEYDLYARNKDFLISDSAITFMDTNGKLMALKPDVTLSIVKNSKDDSQTLQKLYYNENVYRVSKSTHSFKEIMQVGLECLGNIDDYCICEVLTLAAESLGAISPESILDISHLGLLSQVIDAMGIPSGKKDALLKCIGEKNPHELTSLCRSCGVSEDRITMLKQIVLTSGAPDAVLPKLKELLSGITDTEPLERLLRITGALEGSQIKQMLRFDFSVVDDIHYYNGIVFKGFIHGLPSSVLSGGQYDKLMRKMNRKSGAIGFAVYMDALERLDIQKKDFDVDTVLLYEDGTALTAIQAQVKARTDRGESVMVQRFLPENIKCRQILKLRGSEVEILENNA
ncbi:MAG: ATP phosphoribosyltransferase regulatory subunit [Oscillospiraceae bacterium]|nr:ATP phosphoribosyltransferase regulatory subunit [Oscillospiraceae bacterium]